MNKMTGIILIIIGSVILVAGLFIYSISSRKVTDKELKNPVDTVIPDSILQKKENDPTENLTDEKWLLYDQRINEVEKKLKVIETQSQPIDLAYKNGYDFEKFIVRKFDRKYFTPKEWTGDKFVDGIYAETNTNPDILFQFKLRQEIKFFAVECKWRKNFYKNGIEFANPDQLERYKKYEREKNIPVYIAIGISGTASSPDYLYLIPLREIKTTFLSIYQLKPFEKIEKKNFHYDLNTEALN